jgi:tRNA (guanosine-2'-O-)-methyltransferase
MSRARSRRFAVASERRISRIEEVLRKRQPDLSVVMENIHDPHNVSAMLRSCDATGVMEVQLLYSDEEFPKLGRKSSASANKWIGRRKFRSVDECYAALKEEGYTILATKLTEKAQSLFDLNLTAKVAFVFGNEHRGVSDEAASKADALVRIPMAGMIQSLNVSVACAVCVFEAMRQRIAAGDYDEPKLSEKEITSYLKKWTTAKRR